jgi:hypothetical protein
LDLYLIYFSLGCCNINSVLFQLDGIHVQKAGIDIRETFHHLLKVHVQELGLKDSQQPDDRLEPPFPSFTDKSVPEHPT